MVMQAMWYGQLPHKVIATFIEMQNKYHIMTAVLLSIDNDYVMSV